MYCYSKGPAGDYGFRAVESDYVAQKGEWLSPNLATPDQLAAQFSDYEATINAQDIKYQIFLLENSITARRIREAILGIDNGWLSGVNSQIATLRGQL